MDFSNAESPPNGRLRSLVGRNAGVAEYRGPDPGPEIWNGKGNSDQPVGFRLTAAFSSRSQLAL
jgi:hypothetical protein